MKKFSKNTAIILSVILGVLLVIGLIFSFVPMTFGDKTYVGLSNSINISSDIVGGIYGEFEISTEDVSRADIEQSKGIIRNVLAQKGYNNASVYDIAGEKIRVELSYPRGADTYSDVVGALQKLASGKFYLLSASSKSSSDITLDGTSCIDSVEIKSNNDVMSVSINFNDYGKEQYKLLCDSVSSSSSSSSTIYLAFGDNSPQSVNVSSAISQGEYSSLSLQSESYDGIVDLKQRIEIGCMAVEFKENTISIDTMSASLTAGESAASPEDASFFSSYTYVILMSLIAFLIVAILTIFAIKFGYYAILILVTMLINSVLFLAIICLVPSVEFGFSAFIAMMISLAYIYTYALDFAFAVKKEYNAGKSLSAALETAYKNKLSTMIISNAIMFLSSLALVLLSFGEITSIGVIFAVSSVLGMLTNIFVVPLLIKICLSFDGFGRKLFMLKKHDISAISETEEKEAQ